MPQLIFFDIDGTLVPETSSSQHIASYFGHLELLQVAEGGYANGSLDNRQVSLIDAEGWKGKSTKELQLALDSLPLLAGINETITWCRSSGLVPSLSTLAWQPVGEYLCRRFGFDDASGPSLEVVNGRFSGRIQRHFDEFDKRDAALARAQRIGATADQCVAVGDGRSDIPLFEVVGFSIALNASDDAINASTVAIESADLTSVIPLVENWIR